MNPNEKIMVVPAKKFSTRNFYSDIYDIIDDIYAYAQYKRRGDVENDYNYLQIIPYCIVINETDSIDFTKDHVFVTHRVSSGDNRLLNQYSLGIGGHIREPEDIREALYREIKEEVGLLDNEYSPSLIGTIQSAITDVDRVHLGVVYFVNPKRTNIQCLENELEGQWMTIKEIAKIYDKLESWSQIVFDTWLT